MYADNQKATLEVFPQLNLRNSAKFYYVFKEALTFSPYLIRKALEVFLPSQEKAKNISTITMTT